MAFKFHLQHLLELRNREADDLEILLESHKEKLKILKNILELEKNAYFAERDELNQNMLKGILSKIPIYESSLELRKQRMLSTLEGMRNVEDDITHTSISLKQAKRNAKILDRLKDQKEEEFNLTLRRKDQKSLDEHTLQQFHRRQAEEKQYD